jgi:hypothetical protein
MMQGEEDCARLIGFSMIFVPAVYFHNNENAPFWLLYNHFTRYFFLTSSFQHPLWHPRPTRPGPAPNDTALWHIISTGYTSQYDLPNTVGNAPGPGSTHMSTNTGQEATDSGLL